MPETAPINLIRWHYLWYVALALVVVVAVIGSHHLWSLNFLHVFCGLLWTGIDLFMGFVLGPILRVVAMNWPQYGWVASALVLVVLMTVQGIGYLLPTNFRACLELQKDNPDSARLSALTNRYFFAVALQGLMQIVTITSWPGSQRASDHHRAKRMHSCAMQEMRRTLNRARPRPDEDYCAVL